MTHKSPAKQLRSIKRITKYQERKQNNILPSPIGIRTNLPAPSRSCPDVIKPVAVQITLADFKLLMKSENEKRAEERKRERLEDLKKLELLLALPSTWGR